VSDKEPGWYPDPIRGDAFDTARFWDGRAWTERLRAATRAEKRQWAEADLAEKRERVAEVRARAAAGDHEAQAIITAATSGQEDRVARGMRLASWGARWGATVVDGLIVQILATVLSVRFIGQLFDALQRYANAAQTAQANGTPAPGGGQLLSDMTGPLIGITVVYLAVAFAFEVGFIATLQATPGKLLLHLQVEPAAGGGVVGVGPAIVRWAVKVGVNILRVVPLAGFAVLLFYLLDRLWPLWDERNQALHDKAARTIVVTSR
jgi:uncharacterized RDD family membrane protein YckC